MRISFSKSSLDAIKRTTSRTWYRDTKLVGLSLMVTPAGTKTFYVDVWRQGVRTQVRIGVFPELDVDRARQLARDEITAVEQGRPVISTTTTFEELFREWHAIESAPKKRTAAEDLRKFDKDLPYLHKIPVRVMATRDVEFVIRQVLEKGRHRKAGGRVNANRVLVLIKSVLNWGVKRQYLDRSVADVIDKFGENQRERFLGNDELERFLAAANNQVAPWPDFFKLLLYTGGRRGSVVAMRWCDIDLDLKVWTIPSEVSKSKRIVRVPLIEPAFEILARRKSEALTDCRFVFPSDSSKTGHLVDPRKSWDHIVAEAHLQGVTMHDLRRSLGSHLAAANTSLHIIGKILGHAPNSKATSVYARLDLSPLRAAMDKISDRLSGK